MISFLFIFLAGFFNACMDCKRDNVTNHIGKYCNKGNKKLLDWYNGVGGNAKFNPAYPSLPPIWYSSDAWHTFKYYWILCWTFAVVFAVNSGLEWWWYLLSHFVHGLSFIYFYHYGLPTKPDGNLKHYLLRMIVFWKNAHAK